MRAGLWLDRPSTRGLSETRYILRTPEPASSTQVFDLNMAREGRCWPGSCATSETCWAANLNKA